MLQDDLSLPTTFGSFRLVRLIGEGGMARVYEARLSGLHGFEKHLAVKMILPELANDKELVNMLIDEARIAVALGHSNICQVHDFGCIDGTYYIAMEYIDGADLLAVVNAALKARVRIPYDIIAEIGRSICSGLDYAHKKVDEESNPLNIIHRDISPANILISMAGQVKIVDFGMAKAARRSQETSVGVIKGKYQYMAPEQILGRELDHRCDIFSAGIVLYESIGGRMMYREGPDLFQRVRLARRKPLRELRKDLPSELSLIIDKALSRRADDRYQSAGEMGEALDEFRLGFQSRLYRSRLEELMTTLFAGKKGKDKVRGRKKRSPRPAPPAPPAPTEPVDATRPDASVTPGLDDIPDDERTMVDPHLLIALTHETITQPWGGDQGSPDEEADPRDWHSIPETTVVPSVELQQELPTDSDRDRDSEPPEGETMVWTGSQGDNATQVNADLDFIGRSNERSVAGFFLLRNPASTISGPFTRAQLRHMVTTERLTSSYEIAPLRGTSVPGNSEDLSWVPAGIYVADTDTEFEARVALHLSPAAQKSDLANTPVAQLLLQLADERLDGVIIFNSDGAHKEVTLREGHPTYASSTIPDEQLGLSLETLGLVSGHKLSRALHLALAEHKTLADTLIEHRLLDERTVKLSLQRLVRTRLLDLFTWKKGGVSIHRGAVIAAPLELRLDPIPFIMEGIMYATGNEGPIGWLWQREQETFILTGDSKSTLDRLGVSRESLDFLERFSSPMKIREAIDAVMRERLNGDDIANAIIIACYVGYVSAVVE